jgi:hypothetical protein
MKRPKPATVHSLTAERARRGRLPWTFTIDVGANRFVMRVRSGATLKDIEALATELDAWSVSLRKAARSIRKQLVVR